MIPVDQEYFYDKGEIGDCVRAVTASILELDRNEVPHFVKLKPGSDWYEDWQAFMINRGVTPIMNSGPWKDKTPPIPLRYYLASGTASRGCKHIVIMSNGKLAHDPHPSREGLTEIEAIWILT
jgi:hypothetical protein